MKIRLLDLDHVPYLHSQTIYHAVAYCTTEASPGTIIILSPREPYVCIGYHQMLEREIDVGYCKRDGIPVIRREVGGGAVYLDRNQLFFQCVFPRDKAPMGVHQLYRRFLRPAVNTYRRLGVDAYYLRGNDIQVDGRKICGAGAGRIEDAAVVVGNIMFDFDYAEMARILRLSSEEYRDMVYHSMKTYVTTLRKELGYLPDRQEVKGLLAKEFEEVLGASLLHADGLAPDEQEMLLELDKKFTDPDWLYQKGGMSNNWTKISTDVKILESSYQSSGGLIKVIVRLRHDIIDAILISGDFSFKPTERLHDLANQLTGRPLEHDSLLGTVESFYAGNGIESPGVGPEDIVKAIIPLKT